MLYRVSGLLFFLFGSSLMLSRLFVGGDHARAGGGGFASDNGNLITGAALFAVGLYVLFKCSDKKA